ncbi:hypothetical protein FRX31_028926 [Thalictrum thalictroides]|uniref:Uncharacterized protein n=1 Tax=Thalictrum thalictroides TaxID=46969 RepID=A0A7J6VA04_THATH|nr:hypothetical protein FRX31_028926 [Thalictrum thalictroides]
MVVNIYNCIAVNSDRFLGAEDFNNALINPPAKAVALDAAAAPKSGLSLLRMFWSFAPIIMNLIKCILIITESLEAQSSPPSPSRNMENSICVDIET